LFDLVASAACLAAWWAAWQQTHDLDWPCEADLFRDMGAAQSILDGQGGADPAFLLERWWYNPLVPALIGALSRALDMPLPRAYATLGAHLNLFAPLALYAMMVVLATRRAALAALLGFLFFAPRHRVSWLHATYSPWLWTCNFAQGLFYLSALFIVWTLRKRKVAGSIVAGIFVGLTLLAHTAPAAILAVTLLVVAGGDFRHWRHGPKAAQRALLVGAIVGAVATIVAWPFLGDVLSHLRLGIRNAAPMQWRAAELDIQYLPELVRWHESLRGAVALVGLGDLILRRTGYCHHARRLVFGWAVAVGLGLAYGYLAQRVTLPPFLPSWHFYFYLHALESVLFGFGIVSLTRIAAGLTRDFPSLVRFSPRVRELGAYALGAATLIGYAASGYNGYRSRMDLVANRKDAIGFARGRTVPLYEWVLRHTEPNDVFLAEEEAAFFAVAAAGRKVVALQDLFSNPYVDIAGRAADGAAMFDRLKDGRWSEFLVYAKRYQVRYVALPTVERDSTDERNARNLTALRRVFAATDAADGWDVYDFVGGASSASVETRSVRESAAKR
jgi:hypothetical protein